MIVCTSWTRHQTLRWPRVTVRACSVATNHRSGHEVVRGPVRPVEPRAGRPSASSPACSPTFSQGVLAVGSARVCPAGRDAKVGLPGEVGRRRGA